MTIIPIVEIDRGARQCQKAWMYTPVERSKLYEQIVEQIQGRIVRGELRAGDRLLPERELAASFGASRTAVREALKTLAQMGLVDMRPGRGTIVTDNTSDAMRSSLGLMMRVGRLSNPDALVELRAIIEPEIAALAAERAGDEQLAALREAVATMERSLRQADEYIAADNRFHRALALATSNPLIVSLVDSIVGLLAEQRSQIFAVPGGPERGQVYHKTLLEAVERHDVELARTAMRAHLAQVSVDVAAAEAEHADDSS
ncbi:MAG: FadR family transcriptional regulator [Chloroflexota bacterium]|nr:FadR family transcriptional regulator [Chloroflexota bacterium]